MQTHYYSMSENDKLMFVLDNDITINNNYKLCDQIPTVDIFKRKNVGSYFRTYFQILSISHR